MRRVLLLALALAGCAPPPPLEPRLDLAGLSEADAVRQLGIPDAVDPGPPRRLIWTGVDATRVPSSFGPETMFRCTVTAFVDAGRIASYSRQGNGC